MNYYRFLAASVAAALLFATAGSAAASVTPISVSCAGVAGASSITWAAVAAGGVAPVELLWSNGATTTTQVVSYTPGTYTVTVQATDASSSIATSTCSATVASNMPTISSFSATPSVITLGQSAVLSWTVTNASSTSLDQGIGAVSSTSVTVAPVATTTYTLIATNPDGSTTAQATVAIGSGSSTAASGGTLQDQINALLAEIAALKSQLAQLIASSVGGAGATTGSGNSSGFTPPGQVGKIACMALNRDLREGDRGGDVMKLQQILASDPSSEFNASTTGYFGPLTQRALMRFQVQQGIVSSESETNGQVGSLTRGFFNRSCGEGLTGGNSSDWRGTTTSSGSSDTGSVSEGEQSSTSSSMRPSISSNGQGEGEHGSGNGGQHGNSHDY